jgi:hypothetical protein
MIPTIDQVRRDDPQFVKHVLAGPERECCFSSDAAFVAYFDMVKKLNAFALFYLAYFAYVLNKMWYHAGSGATYWRYKAVL